MRRSSVWPTLIALSLTVLAACQPAALTGLLQALLPGFSGPNKARVDTLGQAIFAPESAAWKAAQP